MPILGSLERQATCIFSVELEERPFKTNLLLTFLFDDASDDTFTTDFPRNLVAGPEGNLIKRNLVLPND